MAMRVPTETAVTEAARCSASAASRGQPPEQHRQRPDVREPPAEPGERRVRASYPARQPGQRRDDRKHGRRHHRADEETRRRRGCAAPGARRLHGRSGGRLEAARPCSHGSAEVGDRADRGLTLSQCSAVLGYSKATTHRILTRRPPSTTAARGPHRDDDPVCRGDASDAGRPERAVIRSAVSGHRDAVRDALHGAADTHRSARSGATCCRSLSDNAGYITRQVWGSTAGSTCDGPRCACWSDERVLADWQPASKQRDASSRWRRRGGSLRRRSRALSRAPPASDATQQGHQRGGGG